MQHPKPEQLTDYFYAALAPEADAAVHAHLAQCASCATAYDDEAALSSMLRRFANDSERELPRSVVDGVWERLANERPKARMAAFLGAVMRPFVAIPAAIAIVLAAVFIPQYAAQRDLPSIDASYYLQDHAAMAATVPFGVRSSVPAALVSNNDDDNAPATFAIANDEP